MNTNPSHILIATVTTSNAPALLFVFISWCFCCSTLSSPFCPPLLFPRRCSQHRRSWVGSTQNASVCTRVFSVFPLRPLSNSSSPEPPSPAAPTLYRTPPWPIASLHGRRVCGRALLFCTYCLYILRGEGGIRWKSIIISLSLSAQVLLSSLWKMVIFFYANNADTREK